MDAVDIVLKGWAKELRRDMQCSKCGVDIEMKDPPNPEKVKENWDLYCAKCFEVWLNKFKDPDDEK